MYLPLTYSFADALQEVLGNLYGLVPNDVIQSLEQYYIVDIPGMIVWSLGILILGILIGKATKD
jgi:hypothetical protein